MPLANRIFWLFLISFSCVGCDQTSKFAALSLLGESETVSFYGGLMRLQLVQNKGAFLSMGASLPDNFRQALFLFGAGGIVLLMLAYALFAKSVYRLEIIALALLIAGAVGNLTDRIVNNGAVIDFINIGVGSVRTGIFNIADVAITSGALLLVVCTTNESWREK